MTPKEFLLHKTAIDYNTAVNAANRIMKSDRVVNKDLLEALPKTHPLYNSIKNSKINPNRSIVEKIKDMIFKPSIKNGPAAIPNGQMGVLFPKQMRNKVYYGNYSKKDLKRIGLPGVDNISDKGLEVMKLSDLSHELHELSGGNKYLVQSLPGFRVGHINVSHVVGRADNNFAASAVDAPTKEIADNLKSIRKNEERFLDRISPTRSVLSDNKYKGLGGFLRMQENIRKGSYKPEYNTIKNGFKFGDRKISRKEAQLMALKEMEINSSLIGDKKNLYDRFKQIRNQIKDNNE